MTMKFETEEGQIVLEFSPSEAKKIRDTLDGFIKAAEESGFPVPIGD